MIPPHNPGNPVMGHTICSMYAISIFSKRPFLQGPYQQWLTSFVRCPPTAPWECEGRVCRSLSLDGPGVPGSWGVLKSRGEPHLARYAPMVFHQTCSQMLRNVWWGAYCANEFLETILQKGQVYHSEGSHVFVQASPGETLSYSKNNEPGCTRTFKYNVSIVRVGHCSTLNEHHITQYNDWL